jgi:hypothetical protein
MAHWERERLSTCGGVLKFLRRTSRVLASSRRQQFRAGDFFFFFFQSQLCGNARSDNAAVNAVHQSFCSFFFFSLIFLTLTLSTTQCTMHRVNFGVFFGASGMIRKDEVTCVSDEPLSCLFSFISPSHSAGLRHLFFTLQEVAACMNIRREFNRCK